MSARRDAVTEKAGGAQTPMLRLRSAYRAHRRGVWWLTVTTWLAVTIALGAWGWHLARPDASALDVLYGTLQLFWLAAAFDTVYMPWQLEAARFAGAVATLSALGLAFLALFRDEVRRWRVRRKRDHAIVCGLGEKGFQVARALRAAGENVVVVTRDTDSEHLPAARDLGVLEIVGDAADEKTLLAARLTRASHLFVLCGQDHVNIEIAEAARRVLDADRDAQKASAPAGVAAQSADGEQRAPVVCRVLLGDDAWWQRLDPLTLTRRRDAIDVQYFNFFDRAAGYMVEGRPPIITTEQDGTVLTRVAVVGDGQVARAVCTHLLATWSATQQPDARLELELWSGKAEELRDDLLADLTDSAAGSWPISIVAEPRAAALDDPGATHAALCKSVPKRRGIGRVYVCLESDHRTAGVAMVLDEVLLASGAANTVVTACLLRAGILNSLLSRDGDMRDASGHLEFFDMMKAMRDPRLLNDGFEEAIARSIHAHYRPANRGTPNDRPWDELSESIRDDNRDVAASYGRYLDVLCCGVTRRRALVPGALVFTDAEVDLIGRQEHMRWLQKKRADGWDLGPRNNELKLNPYMKEWDEMTDDEKATTRRQMREIPEVMAEAGFYVFRSGTHAPLPADPEAEP